jgi:hypothetical protein
MGFRVGAAMWRAPNPLARRAARSYDAAFAKVPALAS